MYIINILFCIFIVQTKTKYMNKKFEEFAQRVTCEIIEELKCGNVIWQKPWRNGEGARNYVTGRAYEGFNQLYLSYKAVKNNYPTACYLSFQQAKALGGHVRKGEVSSMVVYWKISNHKTGKKTIDASGEQQDETRKLFYPFIHYVFNIAQIEGVTLTVKEPIGKENESLPNPEEIISRMPLRPQIVAGGNDAYYSPLFDFVQMPHKKHFLSSEAYYSCLFHELTHATGHGKRLGRFESNFRPAKFGDENYSREELIAEMGAVYLSSFAGISNASLFSNSAAYLNGWMKALTADNTLIITASNKAQKAAAFILGLADMEEGQDGQENSPAQWETAA